MAIGDETATLDRPVALHGMTLGCGFAFVDGTNRIDLGRSGIRALDATSAKAYSIGVLAPEGLLGRAVGEDAPAVREAPRGWRRRSFRCERKAVDVQFWEGRAPARPQVRFSACGERAGCDMIPSCSSLGKDRGQKTEDKGWNHNPLSFVLRPLSSNTCER